MPDAEPAPFAQRLWKDVRHHVLRAARSDFSREQATAEERAQLAAAPQPVTAPHVQDYLAWRRSMGWVALIPLAVLVLLSGIEYAEAYENPQLTDLMQFMSLAWFATEVVLLVAVVTLIRRWREAAVTRRRLWIGWLVSFLGPILLCLIPLSAAVDFGPDAQGFQVELTSLIFGIVILVALAPTFLSIFPAIARAGLTVKTLFPARSDPAAASSLMAPLYAAGFLLVGVILQQVGGSFLLALGVLVFLAGPLSITYGASALMQPLSPERASEVVRAARRRASMFVGAGGLVILVSLFLIKIVGVPLVGFGEKVLVGPATLVKLAMGFVAKLHIVCVVAADAIVGGMWAFDRLSERDAAAPGFARDAGRLDDVQAALRPPRS
jgi:hypothetical protein